MTYAMGKVIGQMERMPTWVQNLVRYVDIREIADDTTVVTTKDIHDALLAVARERRDNS